MSRRRRKKRKTTLPYVLILVIATFTVAGICIAAFSIEQKTPSKQHLDAEAYFGAPGEGERTIVTTEAVLPEKGIVYGDDVFIPYAEVKEYINPHIYYDETADILTVTTPESVINADESEEDKILKNGDGIFLSAAFLASCSDIEIAGGEGPQYVIRTRFDLSKAAAAEELQVRLEPDIKSAVIRDVPAGESVYLLGEENGFRKVSTEDGYIGFADISQLGEAQAPAPHTSVTGIYTHVLCGFPVCLAFHQTDSMAANNALSESLADTHGINVIAPTWYFLNDTDGGFTDLTSASYVQTAHALGMQVWAVANDFDGGIASPADTQAVISSTAVRQRLAEEIAASAEEAGVDGICLDFENVREESADAYLMFIRELSVICRKKGLILSVCSYVPQNYNLYLDRAGQAEAADYIITMAYDQHFAGSEEAGSVSDISWVRQAAEETIREVDAARVIIALPFYTRIWESDAGSRPTSRALSMREAEKAVSEYGMKVVWDSEAQQDYAESGGGVKRQIWLENARSLTAKTELLEAYPIAGIAAWKLGLEKPEIWDIMEAYIQHSENQ